MIGNQDENEDLYQKLKRKIKMWVLKSFQQFQNRLVLFSKKNQKI